MKTTIDPRQYTEQREALRKRFQAEKTGEQTQFLEYSKMFQPITEAQNKASKSIKDEMEKNSNALVPLVRELQKRNDQLEALQSLPLYNEPPAIMEPILSSTPRKLMNINLDKGLDTTDFENLEDLNLDKPSEVHAKGTFDETLKKIETNNREIGQYLSVTSKRPEKEKEMYESRKKTLAKYKKALSAIKEADRFIQKSGTGISRKLCKQKRARGRPKTKADLIMYNTADELCKKLGEFVSAKQAGNTGVDNYIVSILDELREIGAIEKDKYSDLFKKYIPNLYK